MGSLLAELNTTTGEITPNYLRSWSLDTSVGSVVHVQAPTLLAIVHTSQKYQDHCSDSDSDILATAYISHIHGPMLSDSTSDPVILETPAIGMVQKLVHQSHI